jgi:hypothetical protein
MCPTTKYLQIVFAVVFFAFLSRLPAQNHTNNWYFGNHAGINFNGPVPVATNNGQQNAFEGCSAYSDHSGNLLFYSDGLTVWNRLHVPMANGTGLLGGLSSTTSALIVRHPGFCKRYFLFTVQDQFSATNTMRYSIIDMSLNGGLGGVMAGSKNILISNGCAEKITAIPHPNGTDQWIVTHRLSSTSFAAYRLSATGLNLVPVLSAVGAFHPSNCMIGFLKPNHAGTKLVSAVTFCSIIQICDFNSTTGAVSNAQDLLGAAMNGIYGVEFSPNDAILYLSKGFGGCALYQVNTANVALTYLVSSIGGNYAYGGLQLGPNGRIYMARNTQSFLSVVNNPNTWGPGCGFVSNGFSLAPGTSSGFGIVSFPPEQTVGFFPGGYGLSYQDTCLGANTQFASVGVTEYDSIRWNFGNPATGILNTDTGTTASHTYSTTGVFNVSMIVFGCEPDTVVVPLTILPCVLPTGIRLYGTTLGDGVYLSWVAASDDLMDFDVERALDGGEFERIGTLPAGQGNAGAFGFTDSYVPSGDRLRYRVSLHTFDGRQQYSNTVFIHIGASAAAEAMIYPNPQQAGEPIWISLDVSGDELVHFEILDIMGRSILESSSMVHGPDARLYIDSTVGLSPGTYSLRLQSSAGLQLLRLMIR